MFIPFDEQTLRDPMAHRDWCWERDSYADQLDDPYWVVDAEYIDRDIKYNGWKKPKEDGNG
jgi:hypothetical protein